MIDIWAAFCDEGGGPGGGGIASNKLDQIHDVIVCFMIVLIFLSMWERLINYTLQMT